MRSSRTVLQLVVPIVCSLVAVPVPANEPAAAHERGVEAYDRGDVAAAVAAFGEAAEQGYVPSQLRLGYILDISGRDVEAERWFRKAAEQGNAEGKFRLARLYATGESGNPDVQKARRYYREASEAGYGQATVVLANAYEEGGLGLEVLPERALELWRLAVVQGRPQAARRLAVAYEKGELGLAVDEAAAATWDRRRKEMSKEPDVPDNAE